MQYINGLAAQFTIERAPLVVGELAGSIVHLKVTNLPIFGVACSLEVCDPAFVAAIGFAGDASSQRLPDVPDQKSKDHDHKDGSDY